MDLGSPTNQSVGFISGVLSTSGFLGGVANRLGECFWISGDSPCIVNFNNDVGSIAALIYESSYYKGQSTAVLAGGLASDRGSWTNLSESDSKIAREGRTLYAREYRQLWQETELQINKLVHYWTINHTVPQAVAANQVYAYPSP